MKRTVSFIQKNTYTAITLIAGIIIGILIYGNSARLSGYFTKQYSSGVQNNQTEQSAVVSTISKVNPAVVSIVVTKDVPVVERYFENFSPFEDFLIPRIREKGTEKKEVGGGSGFFVSDSGLVITNKHVAEDPEASYTVFTNAGDRYKAEVLARDPLLDIAVLKTKARNTPYLLFADSKNIKLGQTAIAIGNALGEFRNSVSVGVVSGLSRSIVAGDGFGRSELLEEVIQTDAAINPGNSGGPLIDLNGKVIGVNVAVAQGSENIGFALPSNIVQRVVDSVNKYGEIIRPYIGVRYVQLTKAIKEKNNLSVDYGALVIKGDTQENMAVIPGSPADKAGIAEGDIILEVDGVKLKEGKSLGLLIRQKKVGDSIILKILSKNKEKTITVKLEKAPKD